MGRKRLELAGKRFGRLLVEDCVGKYANGAIKWKCKCDCGNTTYAVASTLKSGAKKSCGCLTGHGTYPNSRKITYEGITDSLLGWEKRTGICYRTLLRRYERGWSPEQIFDTSQLWRVRDTK